MDAKVNEIDREVDALSKEFGRFISRFDRLEKRIDEMHREIGTREGRDMFQQIDAIEERVEELDRHVTEIMRDSQSTRKLLEYGDVRLKEIMKALAIIYRNTDDLEENLLEAKNIET